MTVAYVAFGANLGEPRRTFPLAAEWIAGQPGVDDVRCSRLYRTEPVGGPEGQPPFFNGCYELRASLTAEALFERLLDAENRFGRKRGEVWSARTIDLDLVLTDDAAVETDRLVVPHPRLHYRWFALRPLVDLNPSAWHPLLDRSAAELLSLVEAGDCAALVLGDEKSVRRTEASFAAGSVGRCVASCPTETVCLKMKTGSRSSPCIGMCRREVFDRLGLDPRRTWLVVADEPSGSAGSMNPAVSLPAVDCRVFGVEHFADSLRAGRRVDGAADR